MTVVIHARDIVSIISFKKNKRQQLHLKVSWPGDWHYDDDDIVIRKNQNKSIKLDFHEN